MGTLWSRRLRKPGQTHGEPIGEHQDFVRALGKSTFLQKVRQTSAYALRVMGKDLLDEVYIDAPPMVGRSFGEVVKIDRKRSGKEENTPGARVFPGLSANMSEEGASLRDQFGPVRGRRWTLGKPYAPVVPPRPTVENRP